jgi:hypothetical protein
MKLQTARSLGQALVHVFGPEVLPPRQQERMQQRQQQRKAGSGGG